MKDTLEVINRMQSDRVITRCAIGGAVGATLYLEPSATLDVDIFAVLPAAPRGSLVSLSGIYTYLTNLGLERRKKLAALSFTQKIKMLEKLRDRSLALAESRKRLQAGLQDGRSAPSPSTEKR